MVTNTHRNVIVAGAGQAGFTLCDELRKRGFQGSICLIGEEAAPPYQRPPLSKGYLLKKMERERLYFRDDNYYQINEIELRRSQKIVHIDRAAHRISLSSGENLSYDKLVLATGSHPIKLPAEMSKNLRGVYSLRSMDDADALAPEFKAGKRLLVVGGGYIGLEAAAVGREYGLQVTVVEAADRILRRVASQQTASLIRQLHIGQGSDVREGVKLETLLGHNGQVTGAKLSDGSAVETDFVIAGIGARPNDFLAVDANLEVCGGISVDSSLVTSDPNILAIGDCASFPFEGQHIRLESVGNAIDQGAAAARTIMGEETHYSATPWFWSDQFDIKLQIAGLSINHDLVVTRQLNEKSKSFWYYRKDRLICVDAINDPRSYMVARRLIEMQKSPSHTAVADAQIDLKTFLK